MKAIGSSYSVFYTLKLIKKDRRMSLCRQGADFLGHQKRVRYGLPLAISFKPSVSAAQTNAETDEIQITDSGNPRTVRIKFELRKECLFGQQFGIVGDDPALGLWDPSGGVPLIWSDGHVWTAEVDIPIDKLVKYKFILKGGNGTVSWQPGPDRILEMQDTEKTIIVVEDWDNPELQNIVEEAPLADLNVVEFDEDLGDGEMVEQDRSLSEKSEGQLNQIVNESVNGSTLEDETGMVSDGGVPVLVPGLSLMQHQQIKDAELKQMEINNVDNKTSLDLKDLAEPKLTSELEGILETQMQWGRRTLQKFLSSLGFQLQI